MTSVILRILVSFITVLAASDAASQIAAAQSVQERMSEDAASGKPLVAHVVVALCDNWHQRIVPVPLHLGNGDDPGSNLYWGALYGVKTYFSKHDDWTRVAIDAPTNPAVLDRVAFRSTVERDGNTVDTYLIAEAWRGREIRAATIRFLELAGGEPEEAYLLGDAPDEVTLAAGGSSHLVAYVGHNGLMDFASPALSSPEPVAGPRSSVVLACRSRDYFADLLSFKRSHSLLTTNGLMAPEAYTLEATISAWFSGESPSATRDRAADAYADYQNADPNWSRRLFATDE
ncbi:MAG: hypothetical protein QNJ73_01040 [Gammaproteobacteria bacterium]|nr:hypothetical protein [Gammaproteobacteria bacterium]